MQHPEQVPQLPVGDEPLPSVEELFGGLCSELSASTIAQKPEPPPSKTAPATAGRAHSAGPIVYALRFLFGIALLCILALPIATFRSSRTGLFEALRERTHEASNSPVIDRAEERLLLQPFLAQGRYQPKDVFSGSAPSSSVILAPISLSQLEQCGALENSAQGRERLVAVATSVDAFRPRWEYARSSRYWSNDNEKSIRRAQDLLRANGKALVKSGELAP